MEPDIRKREAAGQFPAIVLGEQTAAEGGPIGVLRAANPMANTTLGGLAEGVEVSGPDRFPPAIVMLPVEPGTLDGIDERTVRVFRLDVGARAWHPVWDSGVNAAAGYAWARVRRPGLYVPVGLPRDQVLLALVRALAHHRQLLDDADPGERIEQSKTIIDSFLGAPEADVENLRFYSCPA